MTVDCKIDFANNPERRYFAGELLNGRVELTFHDAMKLRGK